jgi:hypothetical protein
MSTWLRKRGDETFFKAHVERKAGEQPFLGPGIGEEVMKVFSSILHLVTG